MAFSKNYKASPTTNLELIRGQKSWDLLLFFAMNDLTMSFKELNELFPNQEPIVLSQRLIKLYNQILQIEFLCNHKICQNFKISRVQFIEIIKGIENYIYNSKKNKTIKFPEFPKPQLVNEDPETLKRISGYIKDYFKYRVYNADLIQYTSNPTNQNVLILREKFHYWLIMLDTFMKQMKSLSEENIALGAGIVDYE